MAKDNNTSAKRTRAAEHRAKAFALRKAGYSYTQIGASLSLTRQAAHAAVKKQLELIAPSAEEVEEMRTIENARLDQMLAGIWDAATGGNEKAIDRVLRILDRRIAINPGLAAPKPIAPTTPDGKDSYKGAGFFVVDPELTEEQWLERYGPEAVERSQNGNNESYH